MCRVGHSETADCSLQGSLSDRPGEGVPDFRTRNETALFELPKPIVGSLPCDAHAVGYLFLSRQARVLRSLREHVGGHRTAPVRRLIGGRGRRPGAGLYCADVSDTSFPISSRTDPLSVHVAASSAHSTALRRTQPLCPVRWVPSQDLTTAGINRLDRVCINKHNGQKLAVGLRSARTRKAIIPSSRGRLRGRGDTAGKTRPSPGCACPPWQTGQAGRRHGPCPDAGKPATGDIPAVSPRRTGCTVQADTASPGRRIRHIPRGTHIVHTNPVSPRRTPPAGETLPAGTRDRPAVPRWNPRASALSFTHKC